MPELSRFFGIIIKMYYSDHRPPHFHAQYGEFEAIINVQTLGLIGGHLPPRAMGLVMEWASLHRKELLECWKKAEELKPLGQIEPLQ